MSMVFTDREIWAALNARQITIDPTPKEEAVTSTAVDLTLAPTIRVWKDAAPGVELVVCPSTPGYSVNHVIKSATDVVTIPADGYDFKPGKFILGWTVEKITLPFQSRIAARVEGKSGLARLGIGIHVTAPTIHAGFQGPIQLELCNHGVWPVRLAPNMRVCQLIFEMTLGTPTAGYSGQFQDQEPR